MFYIIMSANYFQIHQIILNNKSNCLMFEDIFFIRNLKFIPLTINRTDKTINFSRNMLILHWTFESNYKWASRNQLTSLLVTNLLVDKRSIIFTLNREKKVFGDALYLTKIETRYWIEYIQKRFEKSFRLSNEFSKSHNWWSPLKIQ